MKNQRLLCILLILAAIVGTHVYENQEDKLLKKFINYAFKHDDVVFETDIKDANYLCFFGSVYSVYDIKPSLLELNAHYTPMIEGVLHTHKYGDGTSAIVAVKYDHSLFTIYQSIYKVEFTEWVDFREKRCLPTKNLHYKIKNKKIYITL